MSAEGARRKATYSLRVESLRQTDRDENWVLLIFTSDLIFDLLSSD